MVLINVLINSKIYSERSPANWSIYIPNAHSTQQPFSLRSLKLDIWPKGVEGPLVSRKIDGKAGWKTVSRDQII